MRKILACAMLSAMAAGAYAQTTNLAINNADGTGVAEVFTITELDGATGATFQMWLKPTAWTAATLIGQDNFSVETTADGKVTVSAGDKTATITSDALQTGKWAQLTVTVDNGTVSAYVNNTAATVSGNLPATFGATASAFDAADCVIAQGFKGSMDEIRVWSRALEQEDFFWQNTLNKFNDNYDALAAYWKCDQQGIANGLYDYRHGNTGLHHNGALKGITKVEVADNDLFKYRVVTGYTSLMRFIDRPNINRDMFLMTNDVILLSLKVQEDGSLFPEYPDNTVMPNEKSGYLAEWEGRTGVMSFNGKGAQMTATDSRIPFNPYADNGYGNALSATIEAWIYIDEWVEGAEIFSNYSSDDKCIIIKLGSEADKSLVIDLCGTVATVNNCLETNKWQYVGAYLDPTIGSISNIFFEPISISVGAYDDDGVFASTQYGLGKVKLSGNDMTIDQLPLMDNSSLVIGKNFSGKIDELMVWGGPDSSLGNRSQQIDIDATTGYKWNVGSYNNVALNAYFKADDPDKVGKDYQSLNVIADFMRNYYANHTGHKIRFGIVSSHEAWKQIYLNHEERIDLLIKDLKDLVKNFDGIDVDLEWPDNSNWWVLYNHIVSRIINEVMVDYPEKIFSCSLHGWCHEGFDLDLQENVDYFTMQIYDWPIDYETYVHLAYDSFHEYGYKDEKLLLSYPTTMNYANLGGYKDLFEKYGMNDDNYDPDLNQWTYGSNTYNFNGVNLVKQKQQFIIDEDLCGTMYFDMGNDLRVDDYKSLIRAQNTKRSDCLERGYRNHRNRHEALGSTQHHRRQACRDVHCSPGR